MSVWYSSLFLKIINMSIAASVAILLVLHVRFCLKKMPKIYSYVLWAVVLFRLLCPVSFPMEKLLPGIPQVSIMSPQTVADTVTHVMEQALLDSETAESLEAIQNQHGEYDQEEIIDMSVRETWFAVDGVWFFGVLFMAGYGIFSCFRLKSKLVGAIHLHDNVYIADHISSPFVLGIFRPRIYLLSSMSAQEQTYIILHEKQHIRRGDHIIKGIAYLALCVHWFNPLVWAAFAFSTKDMEMSCDEAVVRKMGQEIRADYSASLLSFSTGEKMRFAVPLAFGEGDTKGRIQNLARWKKPTVWGSILTAVICILLMLLTAFEIQQDSQDVSEPFGHNYRVEEVVSVSLADSRMYVLEYLPFYLLTADYQLVIRDDTLSGEWEHVGGFSEFSLTKENFDEHSGLLCRPDSWVESLDFPAFFRRNNQKAWRADTGEGSTSFYYLLLQKNGALYLVNGNGTPEEDANLWFIFKLTQINEVSCRAVSEGLEAYIEPTYYLEGFDFEYDDVASGEIKDTGELIFDVSWDTDTLVVSEEYYESREDASTYIQKEAYEIQRNAEGKFVLDVKRRNSVKDEKAFYYIQGEDGKYVIKIEFPLNKENSSE